MKPWPIGSRIGSMRYGTPAAVSASSVGSRLSSGPPRSGMTTTRAPLPARSGTTSRFERLTLSTSSAPAPTAVRISLGSNESMLTRMPAPTSSRTTSASSGNRRPGVQPMSMTSAPAARNASAASRSSRRDSFGALLISARISMS